jgi:hypothetical protein
MQLSGINLISYNSNYSVLFQFVTSQSVWRIISGRTYLILSMSMAV